MASTSLAISAQESTTTLFCSKELYFKKRGTVFHKIQTVLHTILQTVLQAVIQTVLQTALQLPSILHENECRYKKKDIQISRIT